MKLNSQKNIILKDKTKKIKKIILGYLRVKLKKYVY
jgi:hypothetical protein